MPSSRQRPLRPPKLLGNFFSFFHRTPPRAYYPYLGVRENRASSVRPL
jgi:hypothetical protein